MTLFRLLGDVLYPGQIRVAGRKPSVDRVGYHVFVRPGNVVGHFRDIAVGRTCMTSGIPGYSTAERSA